MVSLRNKFECVDCHVLDGSCVKSAFMLKTFSTFTFTDSAAFMFAGVSILTR